MRITKDISTFFFKKIKIMKHSNKETKIKEIEIEDYNIMLRPSLDSFIHSYKGLDFSLSDVCIKIFVYFNNILSLDFITNTKENFVIKKIIKQNKKLKAKQIKNLTRSYKTSFNRFNKEPTLYETDEDGVRRREEIRLQKNRIL